jgi:hypothetical protein
MDVIPAIRTAPGAFYTKYLQTPTWKAQRTAALRRAKWACEKCASKRQLQVHHRTYERLGAERPGDLVVLCVGCHEDQHPAEAAHDYVRLYITLAQQVLRDEPAGASSPDFVEALKVRCAQVHLPYSTEKLARALEIIARRTPGTLPPVAQRLIEQHMQEPLGDHESRCLLRQVGLRDAIKTMPTARRELSRTQLRNLGMIAEEIQASIARCEALEEAVAHMEPNP